MKVLTAFLLFATFFICSSAGLKCYEYKIGLLRFMNTSEPSVQVCQGNYWSDYYDYGLHDPTVCATVTFKNGEIPNKECGDAEFCTEKGCIGTSYCKELGTFEHHHPGWSDVKAAVSCCEEDLCNVDSSAKTCKNINSLFYAIILILLCFIN